MYFVYDLPYLASNLTIHCTQIMYFVEAMLHVRGYIFHYPCCCSQHAVASIELELGTGLVGQCVSTKIF